MPTLRTSVPIGCVNILGIIALLFWESCFFHGFNWRWRRFRWGGLSLQKQQRQKQKQNKLNNSPPKKNSVPILPILPISVSGDSIWKPHNTLNLYDGGWRTRVSKKQQVEHDYDGTMLSLLGSSSHSPPNQHLLILPRYSPTKWQKPIHRSPRGKISNPNKTPSPTLTMNVAMAAARPLK